jgi:uncharacterized membrane protein
MNAQTWTELRTQVEREQQRWLRVSRSSSGTERDITAAVATVCGNVLVKMDRLEDEGKDS